MILINNAHIKVVNSGEIIWTSMYHNGQHICVRHRRLIILATELNSQLGRYDDIVITATTWSQLLQ